MAGDVQRFTSSIHDASVSAGFRALSEQGLLLDVTLVVEDQEFRAHKALLATQSKFFRTVFTTYLSKPHQNKLKMEDLNATGFKHVLNFMYYGTLDLSMDTVYEILQAAMYVSLVKGVEFCCTFLLRKTRVENCADIMTLLDEFGLNIEGVKVVLDTFALDNFVPLMSRPDFLSYVSLEKLKFYLANEGLSRFPDIQVYQAIQAWLQHDRRRLAHTHTLIQSTRFSLKTPTSVLEKAPACESTRQNSSSN